jgi:NADH:ubiquinone oxidoreductase subunit B-like Fe-S oxidoreductase
VLTFSNSFLYSCCDSEYCANSNAQFEIGHTQGFIARDPARLEIVVVFRGTFSLKDAITGTWFTFQF